MYEAWYHFFLSLVGFGYGNHDDASFSFTRKISLDEGNNTLDILSMIIGVQVTSFPYTVQWFKLLLWFLSSETQVYDLTLLFRCIHAVYLQSSFLNRIVIWNPTN